MPKTVATTFRPIAAAQIVVRKIPTAENPRMIGNAAPAAAAGTTPAWARPNEVEPAMKQGRPSTVGSPPSVPATAGAALLAAVAASEDVLVLISYPSPTQSDVTSGVAGLSGAVVKSNRG
jgi:hypothetical protein